MGTIDRGESGKFTKREQELADEAIKNIEAHPGLLTLIKDKIKNSPAMSHVVDRNIEGAQLAAQVQAGTIIMERIRKNIYIPMLPAGYKDVFDNQLITGFTDFGTANVLTFAAEFAKPNLPEKMRPYAGWLGDSTLLAAYVNGAAMLNIAGTFQKILSGDVMELLDGAFKSDKK